MTKFKLLPLIVLLALESCSITKRHYLPGYAITWKHKALDVKKPPIFYNAVSSRPVRFATSQGTSQYLGAGHESTPAAMPAKEIKKAVSPASDMSRHTMDVKNISPAGNDFIKYKPETDRYNTSPGDTAKSGKVVHELAKQSLRMGIISFIIFPLIIVGMLVVTAIIAPFAFSNIAANLLLLMGLLFLVTPFYLGIFAISHGIRAIHRINMEPDKYAGKKKAVLGILLGILGMAIYVAALVFLAGR